MTTTYPTWRCSHCGFDGNRVYAAVLEPSPKCSQCGKSQGSGPSAGKASSIREQARALLDQGNPAAAIPLLEQALREAPNDVSLLFDCGSAKYQVDDYPGAVVHLSRLLEKQPEHVDGRRTRGYCRWMQKEYGPARDDLDLFLRLVPDHVEALSTRARCRIEQNDLAGALDDLNSALQKKPDNVWGLFGRAGVYWRQQRWQEAAADYDRIIQLDPAQRHVYGNRAHCRAKLGDLHAAIEDFGRHLEQLPEDGEGYLKRAHRRLDLGDYRRATEDYERAAALTPAVADEARTGAEQARRLAELERDGPPRAFADALCERGQARLDDNESRVAVLWFQRAIDADRTSSWGWRCRGAARANLDQFQEALQDCNRAIEIQPDDTNAWLIRGQVKVFLKDLAGSCADFDESIRLNPQAERTFLHRAQSRIDLKDFASAEADFTCYLERRSDEAQVWLDRGWARRQLGRHQEAIADFNRAIELNPKHPNAFSNRAYAREAVGDRAGAAADFRQALVLRPDWAQELNPRIAQLEGTAPAHARPSASALRIDGPDRIWRIWFFSLLALAGVALVVGILLAVNNVPLAREFLMAAAAFFAGATFIAWRRGAGRRWLEPTTDGFRLTDRQGTRSFTFNQVLGFRRAWRVNYSSFRYRGSPNSLVRAALQVEQFGGGTATIPVVYQVEPGQDDPLTDFWQRLTDRLTQRTLDGLAAGQVLEGDGWNLSLAGVRAGQGEQTRLFGFADLALVSVFDEQVGFWPYGVEEPAFRVPIGSWNARVLRDVLAKKVHVNPARDPVPQGDQLGRLLFQRRAGSAGEGLLFFSVGTLMVGLVLGVGFVYSRPDAPKGTFTEWLLLILLLGGFLFVPGAAMLAAGFRRLQDYLFTRLRFHEYGLERRSLYGRRRLRYGQLASLTWDATNHFTNGVYDGTILKLEFAPPPELGLESVHYSATLPRGFDDDLFFIRDHVARLIARRMDEQLRKGQAVVWTPRLRLLPEGLEYEVVEGKQRRLAVLPFDDSSFRVDQGFFQLYAKGKEAAVFTEPTSARNYFPGQQVLRRIYGLTKLD